jgi:hypothetical protein
MNRRTVPLACFLALALSLGAPTVASAQAKRSSGATKEEFFIISSLNMQKREILLKMPTEVTMQLAVTAKTTVVGQNGKPMKVTDLRSGDTGYFTYVQNGTVAQALSIRLAGMTRQNLRPYLDVPGVPAPESAPTPKPAAPPVSSQQVQVKVERGRAEL